MTVNTVPFDAVEYMTDPESQLHLLSDALESGHAPYITHALCIIAKARGIAKVAEDVGISRSGLYKALADDGDPRLTTFVGTLKALGIKLVAQPV